MSIQCCFFETAADMGCRALGSVGAALSPRARHRLETTLCCTGAFIQCPIFRRAQFWLAQARPVELAG
jgi:hypothetical protein